MRILDHGLRPEEAAKAAGVSVRTAYKWLGRFRCYEYDAPGRMLHLDINKLGCFNRPGHRVTADRTLNSRGAGWEYVHVAIDDHSRLAMASVHPDAP